MTRSLLFDQHPMYAMELSKKEMEANDIDEVVEHFKKRINEHEEAVFIALFDHLAHTKKLHGEIVEGLINAKNIVLCFGHKIPNLQILAFRPRSIAICELETKFVIEFLETPRPEVNELMKTWTRELKKQ